MLDGVAHEVRDDAPNAAGIYVDRAEAAERPQLDDAGRQRPEPLDDLFGEHDHVCRLGLERDRPRVVARNLEQIGEQRLEAIYLIVEHLHRAGGAGLAVAHLRPKHLCRKSDRGEWRAQLMRHV